jgi:hypothetical protein
MASMVTSNLSYFVNLGAGNDGSTAVLLGDRDLKRELPGGSPDGLLTGVREFGDRDSGRDLVWGRKQHRPAGNMAFADGTVRRVVNAELPSAIANPNAPAARLLFPQ